MFPSRNGHSLWFQYRVVQPGREGPAGLFQVVIRAHLAPAPWSAAATRRPSAGASVSCVGQYGISDRMPRPTIPGDKRTLNERIVEPLTNQVYDMEPRGESQQRMWAYRKAAWAIEDTEQDLGLIYGRIGPKDWRALRMWGRGWRRPDRATDPGVGQLLGLT